MSSLIVHHVDEAVVRALRERAAQHGRSVEAEHRILLAEALLRPRRRALAEVLAEMPDVGLDRDFERPSSAGAAILYWKSGTVSTGWPGSRPADVFD